MHEMLALAIGFLLVLGTVGVAFVFGLAMQPILKTLIGEAWVGIVHRPSVQVFQPDDLRAISAIVVALVLTPLLFVLVVDRAWEWIVQILD